MQDRYFNARAAQHDLTGSIRLAWTLVLSRWRLIASLSLGCAALAATIVTMQPRSFAGHVTIEIGKFKKGPPGLAPSIDVFEPPALVAAILEDLAFRRALVALSLKPGLISEGADIDEMMKSLGASQLRGINVVSVAFRGPSRELTRAILEGAAQAVIARHEALAKQLDSQVDAYRAALVAELAYLEQLAEKRATSGDVAFTIGQLQQVNSINARILALRELKFQSDTYARSPATPSRMASAVWVSSRPVGIGSGVITLMALFGGALAGILFALLAVTGRASEEREFVARA